MATDRATKPGVALAPSLSTRASLLLRLRPDSSGRELAWDEFHRLYAPVISGFVRKLGVKGAEADEVVQDVLVGFFRDSERFVYDPTKGRFRSFLKVCTFRTLCKSRQRGAKFRGVPVEQVDPEAPEVEQEWDGAWEREQVRRALVILKQRYDVNETRARTFRAFELAALDGRPQEDVARELGISIESVQRAKYRLTTALKQVVDDLRESEG